MIIDGDTHISFHLGDLDIGVEDLIKLMDENGVDKAICWPMVSYTRQVLDDNRAIAQGMRKYEERIIGFGGLNPRLGLDKAEDELKKCVEKYGMQGFKLNGARDQYYIDDKALSYPLIEEISKRGLVLALHSGNNDPARTHPWRIGNIARSFPEIKILMIHMGGVVFPGLYDSAIKITEQFPNIYIIATEADPKAIIKAINVLGAERVCYGSDAPFTLMQVAKATFLALLEDFSEKEQKLVMAENLLRIFSSQR